MGEVYRARDVRLGREVALKILPAALEADAERLARFLREARAASAVNHPGVARLYDVGEHEGVNYLVMELVEGESLDRRLERGTLPVEELLRIAGALASALAEAHQRGVVHRDIKPANVMLTSSGEIKVLDFGVAKLQPVCIGAGDPDEETLAMTNPGAVLGTPLYMSPEQVLGREVDQRSDLFSLGVLLYQAATGRLPFRGRSQLELLDQIVRAEPPAPSELRAEIPPALEGIILRCIAKSPEQRFQSAAGLLAELERAAAADSPAATPKPSLLVLPFKDISPAGDNEYFSDGLTEEIIASLSMIQSLALVSRSSAMRLKGSDGGRRGIGEEMNVRYVLEGSVRKSGDALRITAQLIDTASDVHLWANTYKGSLEDVFEIQEMVATRIAEALKVELSLGEKVVLTRRETSVPEAYDRCLRARHMLTGARKKDLSTAIDLFRQAIELDSRYAVAHAGRAEAEASFFEFYDRDEKRLDTALESALKALMYDPNLAEAFAALAMVHYNKGNLDDARVACERSIELDPDNFVGYWMLGRLYHVTDEERAAIAVLERAIELNEEFYPAYFMLRMVTQALGEGWRYKPYLRRLLEEIFPRYLARFPDDARALNSYGMELFQAGRVEESRRHVEKALAGDPDDPLILYATACYYSVADERQRALDLLERAVAAGYRNTHYIARDPDFRNLHGEERYRRLASA